MTDLTDRLDEIQARADAATEGPWRAGTEEGVDYGSVMGAPRSIGGGYVTVPILVDDLSMYEGTAEFIAASRTDVPQLVAALEKVLRLHPRVVVLHADPEFGRMEDDAICGACIVNHEPADWPCPNVRAITTALDGIR